MFATSNRPSDVDERFRHGGRFEYEIDIMDTPHGDRYNILYSSLDKSLMISECNIFLTEHTLKQPGDKSGLDVQLIAERITSYCSGYVAADIVLLSSQAQNIFKSLCDSEFLSIRSKVLELENNNIENILTELIVKCFKLALKLVPPSSLKGVSSKLLSINYDDVIGNYEAKKCLKRLLGFCNPINKSKFELFGIKAPGGLLLHGPPGNSKTRLVKAAVASHNLPMLSLSSADVYSVYVGDAEATIRSTFRLARLASPCVLFLDELDALVTNRSSDSGSSSQVEVRIMATLLSELDGIGSSNQNIVVIAATNRINSIDAALIRKVINSLSYYNFSNTITYTLYLSNQIYNLGQISPFSLYSTSQ